MLKKSVTYFLIAVFCLACSSIVPAGAPYSGSSTIAAVSWDFAGQITGAPGSDLWGMTWGNDGSVYMQWGDGGGFNGTDTVCRTQRGVAKIDGNPGSFTYTNITGCKADGAGCVGSFTHNPACDTLYANTVSGYADDILDVAGTLYSIIANGIYKSTDSGATWTNTGVSWSSTAGSWMPTGFVQFGQGYAGAPNNYVYIMGAKWGPGDGEFGMTTNIYLSRVLKTSMETQGAYEWYTSTNPSLPTWGAWGSAQPIWTDANRTKGVGGRAVYFPILGKYILSAYRNTGKEIMLFDSANPWGPWTTVAYDTNWGTDKSVDTLSLNISTKWLTDGDTKFWMSYSTTPGKDNFNLIQGTFTLRR